MFRFRGFQLVVQFADLFYAVPVFSNLFPDFLFNVHSSRTLILDTRCEPTLVVTRAIQPITESHQRVDQPAEAEIAENSRSVFIARTNLLPDDFANGFTREIEALLFVQY